MVTSAEIFCKILHLINDPPVSCIQNDAVWIEADLKPTLVTACLEAHILSVVV